MSSNSQTGAEERARDITRGQITTSVYGWLDQWWPQLEQRLHERGVAIPADARTHARFGVGAVLVEELFESWVRGRGEPHRAGSASAQTQVRATGYGYSLRNYSSGPIRYWSTWKDTPSGRDGSRSMLIEEGSAETAHGAWTVAQETLQLNAGAGALPNVVKWDEPLGGRGYCLTIKPDLHGFVWSVSDERGVTLWTRALPVEPSLQRAVDAGMEMLQSAEDAYNRAQEAEHAK